MDKRQTLESVKEYYGKVLQATKDLKTTVCCTTEVIPSFFRDILADIHPEVKNRFYGCGTPIPPLLEGCTVLDLGCGTGRDCFLMSKLVGPSGKVIGVDMTDEQLRVAQEHMGYHADKFGYSRSNVQFVKGYIEDLESLGIKNESMDVVVSNCVVNLSPDKERVFSEIFRVLKPGGELYYSDVFSGRRIPKNLTSDPVLLGECLGGALYLEDLRRILNRVGCSDPRAMVKTPIQLTNPEVYETAGMIDFYSVTMRAFKLSLEDRCEDYGQVAYYLGSIPHHPHEFSLDDHHCFKTGMPLPVCSNTAAMLSQTRFSAHFKVAGDLKTHYGLFNCGPDPSKKAPSSGGACC